MQKAIMMTAPTKTLPKQNPSETHHDIDFPSLTKGVINRRKSMKTIVRETYVFPLFLILLVCSSCAAPVIDTSKLQYIAPEFKEDSLVGEGLSLLPVVAGAGQEGLRRPLGDKLNKHLGNELPEGKFIGTLETMDLINNAELTGDYSKLIEDYDRSAILNKSILHKIGEAVGVEHLLYVKLLEQVQTRGLTPGVLTKGLVETRGTRVNLFGQVWSCTLTICPVLKCKNLPDENLSDREALWTFTLDGISCFPRLPPLVYHRNLCRARTESLRMIQSYR